MTWVYFMREKSEVFTIFKKFKNFVEKSSGHHIKILRSDRGKEYSSTQFNKFCEDEGVKRQLTVGYAPEQNGVSERKNRTTNNIVISQDVEFDEDASWNWEKDKVEKQTYLPQISIETSDQQPLQVEHSEQQESTGETSPATPTSPSTRLPLAQDESSPESTPGRVKALAEVYEACNFTAMEPESYEVAAKDEKWPGVDYNETFAPVARLDTIRALVALAAQRRWKIYQLDVKSAFLNGFLEEEIYVEQPQGFIKKGKENQKQETVAQSSAEAEYVAAANSANQAIWLKRILEDMGEKQDEATKIFCNNKSAIAMAKNPVFHGRTKILTSSITFCEKALPRKILN
ncbi:uncharacterized protein [Rutidosis leptorrhynchoides]|uniref:uncharacterized protein n=1 Tax=Rutidosis leptorrhynchoides TaxID=125765 RepID=UPI003A99E401